MYIRSPNNGGAFTAKTQRETTSEVEVCTNDLLGPWVYSRAKLADGFWTRKTLAERGLEPPFYGHHGCYYTADGQPKIRRPENSWDV